MTPSNPLVGVWKIVSFQVEIEGAQERNDVYDRQPSEFLIITDEGRMMALITAGERATDASPETLFNVMTAYSGQYRLERDCLITKVDSAWHPSWIGTEQTRYIKMDRNTLSLASPPQQHPRYPGQRVVGIVTWEREDAVF